MNDEHLKVKSSRREVYIPAWPSAGSIGPRTVVREGPILLKRQHQVDRYKERRAPGTMINSETILVLKRRNHRSNKLNSPRDSLGRRTLADQRTLVDRRTLGIAGGRGCTGPKRRVVGFQPRYGGSCQTRLYPEHSET